jgi:hypothetical protein
MRHDRPTGAGRRQQRDPFPTEAIRSVNREPCTHDVDSDPLGYYDVAGKDASRVNRSVRGLSGRSANTRYVLRQEQS